MKNWRTLQWRSIAYRPFRPRDLESWSQEALMVVRVFLLIVVGSDAFARFLQPRLALFKV